MGSDYPDIVTGWNIKFFDIPYLINRIKRVLGEGAAKKFSPWNKIREKTITAMGREHLVSTSTVLQLLITWNFIRHSLM